MILQMGHLEKMKSMIIFMNKTMAMIKIMMTKILIFKKTSNAVNEYLFPIDKTHFSIGRANRVCAKENLF